MVKMFSFFRRHPETTEREVRIRKLICKRPHLENVKKFCDDFIQSALNAESETEIPAIAMLAQVALETGWGKHILKVWRKGERIGSRNLFNIKAFSSWNGKKGTAKVWEIVNGEKVWVDGEPFRVYNSYEDSFVDYCNLILKTKRYSKAVENRNDPDRYIREVHRAGYATDPEYSNKIVSIMNLNFEYEEVEV